jgi:hypothetical protein
MAPWLLEGWRADLFALPDPLPQQTLDCSKGPIQIASKTKKMSNDRTHFLQVNTPLAKSGHPDCCPEIPIVERFWY